MKKNILLVHGYLLEGTGSNIYVANIAKTLCQKGHDVFLVCQQPDCSALDFVSQHNQFDAKNQFWRSLLKRQTAYRGKCYVFNPDLGGLLPVYVWDDYKNFKVIKTFPQMSTPEIQTYVDKNVTALRSVMDRFKIDVVHTNHSIMSPYIAVQALGKSKIPHVVSLHGSAFNISIKSKPQLKKYAIEGFSHAKAIFISSNYFKKIIVDAFSKQVKGLSKKIRPVPCGVDVNDFVPATQELTAHFKKLRSHFIHKLSHQKQGKSGFQKVQFLNQIALSKSLQAIMRACDMYAKNHNFRQCDQDIVKSLAKLNWGKDPMLMFIGKLIDNKGPHLFIFALPFLLKMFPTLKIVMVGFGTQREVFEAMLICLIRGKKELFLEMVKDQQKKTQSKEEKKVIEGFLKSLKNKKVSDEYFDVAKAALSESIIWTGILNHDDLKYLGPLADVLVVPSIFPESFGMIAAEGMSMGVPTLCSYHSSLKDMSDIMEKVVKPAVKLRKLKLDEHYVENLVYNIEGLLKKKLPRQKKLKSRLHAYANKYFSWAKITDQISKHY